MHCRRFNIFGLYSLDGCDIPPSCNNQKSFQTLAIVLWEENISQLRGTVLYSSFRLSYHVASSDSPQSSSFYFFCLEALWRIYWRGSLLKVKGQVDGTVVMLLRKSEDYVNYCSWYPSVWGNEGEKGVTMIPRVLKQVNNAICR